MRSRILLSNKRKSIEFNRKEHQEKEKAEQKKGKKEINLTPQRENQ